MTVAVTRARELRWLRLESSGEGGSYQSAAVEAGLKQGSAGTGLRARLRWEFQGTLGGGECKVTFWLTPTPAYIEPLWTAEESSLTIFSLALQISAQMVVLYFKKKNFKINY